MATAHQFSVLTNSLVKQPLDPQTGRPVTKFSKISTREFAEHEKRSHTLDGKNGVLQSRNENSHDSHDMHDVQEFLNDTSNIHNVNGTRTSASGPAKLDATTVMGHDVMNLSSEEFYDRLVELKKEQQRTLELCESLYKQKLAELESTKSKPTQTKSATQRQSQVTQVLNSTRGMNSTDYELNDLTVTGQSNVYKSDAHSQQTAGSPPVSRCIQVRDSIKDMSFTKPPMPPTTLSTKPKLSDGLPAKSTTTKSIRTSFVSRGSDDEEPFWKAPVSRTSTDVDTSEDERNKENVLNSSDAHNNTRLGAMSRIEDMWENFSVDDYAPWSRSRPASRRLVRSSSLSKLSASVPTSARGLRYDVEQWQKRLTIPEPFNMSLRESGKTPRKTRAMIEVERRREERFQREEEECQRKFKASPVPAHVYMPLFSEIMESNETRRRSVQQNSRAALVALQQPFEFDRREEEKRNAKREACRTSTSAPQSPDTMQAKQKFKAKPFPVHLFKDVVTDRMREEEEYRQIRKQMRAQELLRSASLPPSMQKKGKAYTEGRSRQQLYAERARRAGITVEHKFKPKINETVPDFEELHQQLMQSSQRRDQKEVTVCKPFNMRTSQISARTRRVYEDVARDAQTLKDKQWSFSHSQRRTARAMSATLSTSLDSIPMRMTQFAELRASANRSKLLKVKEKEEHDREMTRARQQKELQMKRTLVDRAGVSDVTRTSRTSNDEKLKSFREADRTRQHSYKQQLDEMNKRLQTRPMLFEQVSQKNAERAAARRFSATLRASGIDMDEVTRQGSSAAANSRASMHDFSDDDDVTDGPRVMLRRGSQRSERSVGSERSARSPMHSEAHELGGTTRSYTGDFEAESSGDEDRTRSSAEMEELA